MDFEGRFTVPGRPEKVIGRFADVERMAACVPGAAIEGRDEEGNYLGVMTVAFGPKRIKFRGRVLAETDPVALTGRLHGRGAADLRQARIETRVDYAVAADPAAPAGAPRSVVSIKAHADLQGVLADFADAGGAAVANALMADFEKRMAAEFATEDSPAGAGMDGPAPDRSAPRAEALSAGRLAWQVVRMKLAVLARSLGLARLFAPRNGQ